MSEQIYCPPQLFEFPLEGWGQWVRQQVQQLQPNEPLPQLLPGSPEEWLLEELGPVWAQEFALRAALSGELKTPAAREVLSRFLAGQPLSLCPWQQEERFWQESLGQVRRAILEGKITPEQGNLYMATRALPWLRYVDEQHCQQWLPPNRHTFPALTSKEAFDQARQAFITWEHWRVSYPGYDEAPVKWFRHAPPGPPPHSQVPRSAARPFRFAGENPTGPKQEQEGGPRPVDETVRHVTWKKPEGN